MTQPIHIMLDLETWGTDPGRDLRSIGACVFDPDTGEVCGADGLAGFGPSNSAPGTFYQNVENPQYGWNAPKYKAHGSSKYPLTRDPSTVEWWSHPDRAEAAAQLLTDVVDLAVGLERFAAWLDTVVIDVTAPDIPHDMSCIRLWSHGENMDEPMLRMAYKALNLPVPWHYRSPRDTRTAFDLAGMDPTTCLNDFQTGGTFHNALDDAVTQARAVCAAYATVNGWRTVAHDDSVAAMTPAQHEAADDIISHAGDFRKALEAMRDNAEPAGVDHDDPGYWQHQIDTYERIRVAFLPS